MSDTPSDAPPAAATDTPLPRRQKKKIERLISQIRWVTRISTALSSAVHVEDVYSVLVAGLVSPTALGYSSVILFDVDPFASVARGKFAVAVADRNEYEMLREELEEEAAFLERRRQELHQRNADDPDATAELRTLELGAQWITLFQRLGPENPVTDKLKTMEFLVGPIARRANPDSFFAQAHTWRAPQALSKRQLGAALPPELAALLPEQFAVVPLRTQKGLRTLLFVDRRVDRRREIRPDEIEELDWFANQGALAVENADLITALETAYRGLKEVDALKSNFLSIVSHELRTPLTAITGFVDLILHEKVGDINNNQRSLLTRVAKNTGHLINMVNDLIEIAEIEAEGMRDVMLVAVDPLATLLSTLPKLEYRRRDKMVEIEPVFDGSVPRIVCDERTLERVFFHLLDNAVKFSPANTPVKVEFRTNGTRLGMTIRDRGIGISREHIQKIFDQFYQVDNSLTRNHEGLGLGLAVTKLLLQATHGTIDVESSPGQGSSFTVSYPIATEHTPAA